MIVVSSVFVCIVVSTRLLNHRDASGVRCDDFDDGSSLLSADYRIDCKTGRYNHMRVVSFVMLAIFPVGVPVALGWTLWSKRHALYPRNVGVVMSVTHYADTVRSSVVAVRLRKVTPELLGMLHSRVRFLYSS